MPIIVQIKSKYEGFVPDDMSKSAFNRMLKAAYLVMGEYWQRIYLPVHFTVRGGVRYGYTDRKGQNLNKNSRAFKRSYSGKKWRKYRHLKPLVFSGQSEEGASKRDVRSTKKSVKIFIHAPALNFRPRGGRINMREEVTTVLPDELEWCAQIFERDLDRQLNRYRARRVTTSKG